VPRTITCIGHNSHVNPYYFVINVYFCCKYELMPGEHPFTQM